MTYSIQPVSASSRLPIRFNLNTGNDAGNHTYFVFAHLGSSYIYGTGNVMDSLLITFLGGSDANGNPCDFQCYPGLGNNNFTITKLDIVANIISGTFDFKMYCQGTNGQLDSMVVTEGRFDLRISDFCRCSQ